MITEARRLVFLSLNFLNLCFCVFLLLSYLFFYFFWCIRFRFKDWGLSTLKTPNQRENQLRHGGTSAFMFVNLCNLVLPVPAVIHAHIMSILSPSFNDQVWTFIRHPTITQPGRQRDIQHLEFKLGDFLDVNWTSMKCAGNLND